MTEQQAQDAILGKPAAPSAYPCDQCGAPAIAACVDFARTPNSANGALECSPIGPKKYGCALHPPVCETHDFARGL